MKQLSLSKTYMSMIKITKCHPEFDFSRKYVSGEPSNLFGAKTDRKMRRKRHFDMSPALAGSYSV